MTTPRKRASRKTGGPSRAADDSTTESATAREDREVGLAMTTEMLSIEMSASSDSLDATIRYRAYELFLARGAVSGDALADWFEAERQVLSARDTRHETRDAGHETQDTGEGHETRDTRHGTRNA